VNNGNVCLQLLGTPGAEKRKREALLDIVNDAARASAIITRIRALTKRATAGTVSLSVKELIADVLSLAHHATIKARVTIKTSVSAKLRLAGDRIQLQQMLLNLVTNGIEAMSAAGEKQKRVLTISAKLNRLAGKSAVFITVRDTGIGFETKESDRLFDAFYTTKPNGMGMGLRISRSAAETHGGRLWADPPSGRGATFRCALPTEVEGAS
jgi:signal transduction histidine kinase